MGEYTAIALQLIHERYVPWHLVADTSFRPGIDQWVFGLLHS